MYKKRLLSAVAFVTISISANSSAQVLTTISEVGALVAHPTNWTRFKELLRTTALGHILLPSTLETGWKNPTFQLITLNEVWLESPGQLRDLLGIDDSTARYLMDLTASQLELGRTKIAVSGAVERLSGKTPPEIAEALSKVSVIGGPPGPLEPPNISIEDPIDFVNQYQRARENRLRHGCDVELCIDSDDVASFSIECKNALMMTITSSAEASFSLAAKSPDGTRSAKVSFFVNKQ